MGWTRIFGVFFEYDTPKIVHIRSKKVGVVNRLIQLLIIGYIVGYVIVWEKGYQDFETVESGVTSKVKGVVYSNLSHVPGIGERIWDVADYVVPSQETNAFFVMTNVIVTSNQSQSTCDEDPDIQGANCTIDTDCPRGVPIAIGNGVRTGKCIQSTRPGFGKVCEIYAWCPVEIDVTPKEAILKEARDFTVLLKNNIEFRKFDVKRRNILPDVTNQSYLQTCNWGREHDRYCPVFRLGDVVTEAGHDFNVMAVKGGVIAMEITWDCNLDHDHDKCRPEYSFRRLDDPHTLIASGWNFRTSYHYAEGGQEKRTLIKAYGIRFIIFVRGTAGKFSFIPLILNFASGIALLAIATTVCDIVMLYILKQKDLFKEKKYENVKGADAYEILDNSTDEPARRRNIVQTDQLASGD